MTLTIQEAYGMMLKDYPDLMDINQMSKALGVSTKTGTSCSRTARSPRSRLAEPTESPSCTC